MKIRKYSLKLAVILSAMILSGCGGRRQTASAGDSSVELNSDSVPAETISVKFSEAIPIDDNLRHHSTIEFDENVENLMGVPHMAAMRGDTIYAIDANSGVGLYAYLKDGSQLWSYVDMGGGPGDLSSPMNLKVTDEEIVVYDYGGKKLMHFTKDGKFKESVDLPFDALGAMTDPEEGIWLDYSNQDYLDDSAKLSWTPDSLSNLRKVLTVPDHLKGITAVSFRNLVALPDGSLRYLPSYEPMVYDLRKGRATLLYEIDFNGDWPTEEEFARDLSGDDWARKIGDIPTELKGYVESGRWLVMGFVFKEQRYLLIRDKTNGRQGLYADKDSKYYSPAFTDDSLLYMSGRDDTIEVLELPSL